MQEINALATSIQTMPENNHRFLQPEGLFPSNLLYVKSTREGFALWHTPPQVVPLFFKEGLGIPSGSASVPALVWKATKHDLRIFSLKDSEKPSLKSCLYHAPFFNLYKDGTVCMGTVNVSIQEHASLETFIKNWENYFFNSYFSHLLIDCAVSVNIVQLWQEQFQYGQDFPTSVLVKTGKTINDLLK